MNGGRIGGWNPDCEGIAVQASIVGIGVRCRGEDLMRDFVAPKGHQPSSLRCQINCLFLRQHNLERSAIFDTRHMSVQLIASTKEAALSLAPLLILLLVAAVAGSIGIGGLLVSGKAIAPQPVSYTHMTLPPIYTV